MTTHCTAVFSRLRGGTCPVCLRVLAVHDVFSSLEKSSISRITRLVQEQFEHWKPASSPVQ
jgi:hypothetical protein